MRRTLIEGLLNGPLTEAAPGPDDPELAALAQEVERAAAATSVPEQMEIVRREYRAQRSG